MLERGSDAEKIRTLAAFSDLVRNRMTQLGDFSPIGRLFYSGFF
jgi:hypothetical protein